MSDQPKPATPDAAQATKVFSDVMTKSLGAFGDVGRKSRRAVEAAAVSGKVTAQTVEELNRRAAAYSKKAAEEALAVAKAIATAKNPQQAIELQTTFATQAFNAYVAEFSAVSTLLVESFNKAVTAYKADGSSS